ncbi:MAG: alkane 1-monooxygenase [Woeseiaceae bacterium]|nr:alkane 1-monooxygenase [Woeseiaceae bacterium]
MKGYTGVLENGEAIHYVDGKRWLWLLSVTFPIQALIPVFLHARTGNELWFLLPLLLFYIVQPALDAVIGTDSNNPPEEVVMQLEQDLFYRRLTYIVVPLHYVTLFVCAVYAGTQDLSWWAFTLLAIVAGLTAGLAINTAHELGHKNTKLEKTLAKFALAVPFYGHFTIEHNRGHHMLVSTPADDASSRMGESIYRFATREIPGAFRRAWEIESERLRSRNLPIWHYSNPILQSYAISIAVTAILLLWIGWLAIPFLLLHHAFAYWQLTSANYVEHYGLLREKTAKGRYERCQPHHSWNCNYLFSNLVLFHLERHSDHHANPLRRYQSLRHYEDVPQLPNGYFGMYVLAYFPPLWYRVMDRRLMALPHVDGDLDKVNICPKARPAIFLKWGRDKMEEPTLTDLPRIEP